MPTIPLENHMESGFKPHPEINLYFGQESTPLYYLFDHASPDLLEVATTLSFGMIDGIMGDHLKTCG